MMHWFRSWDQAAERRARRDFSVHDDVDTLGTRRPRDCHFNHVLTSQ